MTPTLFEFFSQSPSLLLWLIIIGQRRTMSLREKFGPEYDQTVNDTEEPRQSRIRSQRRIARVGETDYSTAGSGNDTVRVELAADQAAFRRRPRGAVSKPTCLVAERMQVRGYPFPTASQRAAEYHASPECVSEYARGARYRRARPQGPGE